MTGSGPVLAAVSAAAALALAGTTAQAGAFMQPEGHGIVIAQMGFSAATRGYDALGRPVAVRAWRKLETNVYGEFGLSDDITLIAEGSFRAFRSAKAYTWDGFETGLSHLTRPGAAMAGGRLKLYETDLHVFSAQASLRAGEGGRDSLAFSEMRRPLQADIRLLYGRRVDIFGLAGFVDSQIAFRNDGPRGHQIRTDSTLGVRVLPRLTLMAQHFSAYTPGRIGGRFSVSSKAQASAVFDVTESVSAQLGFLYALRGVAADAERGVVFALWARF